jgi:hypothetical protein
MANVIKISGSEIKSLPVGAFRTVCQIGQGGCLQARKLSSGAVQLYWRFTLRGKTSRVPIGTYDSSAPPRMRSPTAKGFSLAAAAERCSEMAKIGANTPGGYLEYVEIKEQEHLEQRVQRTEAQRHTLQSLMDTYVAHLEQLGRRSHRDARSIFKLHVTAPFSDLANRPASSIQAGEITDMMRRLAQAGKGRSANKLRSYLAAAYQCALDVNSLASVPIAFKAFGISNNPVASTRRDATKDRPDKNPLSAAQMRTYWGIIKGLPGIKGAALRFHLMTGGQRIEQLVKLKCADVSNHAFVIFDGKGRPGQQIRRHTVPLIAAAKSAMASLPKQGETWHMRNGTSGPAEYILSTDGGRTHISAATMSNWARELAGSIPSFQLKRVRSGVETMLASAGVPMEIRGQLQSHGLTGVQLRHYDAHDYLPEKTDALMKLSILLNERPTDTEPAANA